MKQRRPIDVVAGAAFLVSGALTTSFGLFSVMGTGVGALMASGLIPPSSPDDTLIGILLTAVYALFMVIGLAVGPFQLVVGVRLFLGKRGLILWVGTFASLLPVFLVYCAMPSLMAFGLGLASLLTVEPEEEDEPRAGSPRSNRPVAPDIEDPFAAPAE